jgi:hypothetical protein
LIFIKKAQQWQKEKRKGAQVRNQKQNPLDGNPLTGWV